MMKEILKYSLSFLFIACVHAGASSQDPSQPNPPPPQEPPSTPAPDPTPTPSPSPTPTPTPPVGISFLNPTVYYKPTIYFNKDKCTAEIIDMISPEGEVLVSLCAPDFANCLMQGACFVHDDQGRFRSFNYYARGEDQVPRFKEANLKKCPYGFGVRNSCLDPYFTVAADLKIYKPGDVIYVPRLVGVTVPTGEVHDGFFIVRDRGAAIVGEHRFDFFTGFESVRSPLNVFARKGFADKSNSYEFRMATEEEAKIVRERQGYPGIKREVVLPPQSPPTTPPTDQTGKPGPAPTPTPSPAPSAAPAQS